MLKEAEKELNLYNFNYDEIDDVPLISVVKIDKKLWGRLDILIKRYYRGDMKYFKFLLDFNKISDQSQCRIGDIIKLPDFSYLEEQMSVIDIDKGKIPGVSQYTDNEKTNKNIADNTNYNNETTATPKLKLTKKPVSYDSESGTLTF